MLKAKRQNLELRAAIIRKFGTQCDFAFVIGVDPSRISHILSNRKRLLPEEAQVWQRLLSCKSF
jgi:hypothetical protein